MYLGTVVANVIDECGSGIGTDRTCKYSRLLNTVTPVFILRNILGHHLPVVVSFCCYFCDCTELAGINLF